MPVDVYLFCYWTTQKDLSHMSQFLRQKNETKKKNTTKK